MDPISPETSQLASATASSAYSSLDHLFPSLHNTTLMPAPMDLLLALPRFAHRAGVFALFTVPEQIDSALGSRYGRRIIPDPTANGMGNITATASDATFAQGVGEKAAGVGGAASATSAGGGPLGAFSLNNVRGFGGIFSYMTSKWALSCFTVAIILNRTQVYASPRRHLQLSWAMRLALRLVPIILFLYHTSALLQAIHCQTSRNFSLYRYDDASKKLELDFSGAGNLLYWITSKLLFWQSDHQSCRAVHLVPQSFQSIDGQAGVPQGHIRGSLSFLWPLFQALCFSQFIETLSCTLQGRRVMAETGMTIFEHSLAFAEAESMISNRLGMGPFVLFAHSSESEHAAVASSAAAESETRRSGISRTEIMSLVNTPPEVLLIGLISSLSHLSSHVLGALGWQARFRLVNTGFWGLCFMAAFVWSLWTFKPGPNGDMGILRFPTVCIVGFIPHMLILVGIWICAGIYLLALGLSILSPPPGIEQPQTLRERFEVAQQNLQANLHLSAITVHMHEDFYTALLKIGFAALSAASEAVFLNEGQPVGVRRWTWLEESRLTAIARARASQAEAGFRGMERTAGLPSAEGMSVADGIGLVEDLNNGSPSGGWRSGYARERTTSKVSKGKGPRLPGEGVGAADRSSRWLMVWQLFRGIFSLIGGAAAVGLDSLLDSIGIHRRPRWLRNLARRQNKATNSQAPPAGRTENVPSLDFWMLSDSGELIRPEDGQVDIEVEMKRRDRDHQAVQGFEPETDPTRVEARWDQEMYSWWKHGGYFGDLDSSGDYRAEERDDDTTSVVSASTQAASDMSDDDAGTHGSAGRTTPTQRDFSPSFATRESTPVSDPIMDPSHLAALLDPSDAATRREAQMLSHHLRHARPLTRSAYRKAVERKQARVLVGPRSRGVGRGQDANEGQVGAEEEEELLERLILERRGHSASSNSFPPTSSTSSSIPPIADPSAPSGSTWASGASGLGASGPQCVVCQSSPRTILVWPCRCLSLCEDCRVSLAMNNFGNCVCCRRDVVGFSRLFVP
ncbi:MAG: hypothetical protein M1817_005422 [Caeruleum heppii]|nr:MAG: hypothetical protein M1817_005422 [Caeruleum heppii]